MNAKIFLRMLIVTLSLLFFFPKDSAAIEYVQESQGKEISITVEGNKVILRSEGGMVKEIDLSGVVNQKEVIWARKQELCPISPDGKYLPVLAFEAPSSLSLIRVDLSDYSVAKNSLIQGGGDIVLDSAEWVSSNTLLISYLKFWGYALLYNVDQGEARFLYGESNLAASMTGNNYASVYNKSGYWDRHGTPVIARKFKSYGGSQYIRYNSFWVYPEPLKGFVSSEESQQFHYSSGSEGEYPGIRNGGVVGLPASHIFSSPVFIADTSWVGFLEMVFEDSNKNGPAECQIVLLNAERVTENPPNPTNIKIMKKSCDLGIAFAGDDVIDKKYYDLKYNLRMTWNEASRCLELWKSTGWGNVDENPQKILEAEVLLPEMNIGNINVLADESSINWSSFAR